MRQAAGEDGQPAKQPAFARIEQLVAPVDGGAQRLLTRLDHGLEPHAEFLEPFLDAADVGAGEHAAELRVQPRREERRGAGAGHDGGRRHVHRAAALVGSALAIKPLLTLRDGVTFTDGKKLDSTVVKANLDRRSDNLVPGQDVMAIGTPFGLAAPTG